ncbi:response regulator [Moritella sp. F3]|uniref:response regulator n=1 Tax=Moritella sp. F3 TaxID=2718882 RepID=UPI0018E0DE8F|nr:response regulator [Moritella sp. F3]GIC79286.1 response regulator [Moritella sp. F1]GIC80356.1 response regulator [Moritella sp. F3]
MNKNFDYRNKRVLIVDDQRAFQIMLKTMLINFGAKDVTHVGSAEDALKLCRHDTFDLLLVDYNLGSGINGRQLFEALKMDNLLPIHTVFFLVTGDNSKAIVLSAIQMTPDDYLMKPFSQNELNLRIQKAFNKKDALLPIYQAIKNNDFAQAMEECDNAIIYSARYRNYCRLFKAELLIEKEMYAEARTILEDFIEDHPHTQAQLLLGRVYYLEKKYQQAIPLLTEIIKYNPMILDGYDWLAQCFKDGGDTEKALDIVQRAIKHSHLSLERQGLLAELALDTNMNTIAKEAFFAILMQTKNTIHQNPQHLINYVQAIILVAKHEEDRFKQGRLLQEISGLFHRSSQQHPYVEEGELLALEGYSLASIHNVKGNQVKAKNTLLKSNEAYFVEPEETPEWLGPQLVNLLAELEEFELADKLRPYLQQGDVHSEKLLANISGVEDSKEIKFQHHNKLGIDAFTEGNLEVALQHFETALSIAPLNTGAALNKVQVCLALLTKIERPWPEITKKVSDTFIELENFPLSEQQAERKADLRKEFNIQRMHEKRRANN